MPKSFLRNHFTSKQTEQKVIVNFDQNVEEIRKDSNFFKIGSEKIGISSNPISNCQVFFDHVSSIYIFINAFKKHVRYMCY
jgi:beta-glucanase (GH16 family)